MSKYTFFNKITSDDKLVKLLVSQIHSDFGYNYQTTVEEIKDLILRFKDQYKLDIKYIVVDFENADIRTKYGIKRSTDFILTKQDSPKNFLFIINKKNSFENNRFLFLKGIGYILFDKVPNNADIHLSMSSVTNDEVLAEEFALEFLLPKWKYSIIIKQHPGITDEDLIKQQKQLNSTILDLYKKWCQ